MSRLDNHERKDRIKWAIVFLTVAALIVGFFAIVTKGFTQNDPKQWFSGEKVTVKSGGAVEVTSGAKSAAKSGAMNYSDINTYLTLTTYIENGKQYVTFPIFPGSVVDDICVLGSMEGDEIFSSFDTFLYVRGFKVSSSYLASYNYSNIPVEDLLYEHIENKSNTTFSAGNYSFEYRTRFTDAAGVQHIGSRVYTFNIKGVVEYSGDGVPLPETPSKAGYVFAGWYYDEAFTRPYDNQKITADTQLYAKMEAINYSIMYNIQGWGEVNGKLSYTIADETYTLPIPTRTGYNFIGWYDNSNFTGEPITEIPQGSMGDKTYYAKFEIQVFKVTFYVDGEIYLEMDIEYGTRLIDLYLVDQATMTAVAFSLDSNMLTAYDMGALITDDLSLFAANDFVIYAGLTYNIDGVETMDLLDYNSTLSDLRVPEKDGYTFDGWYYDSEYKNAVKSTDKLTQNKTIYAKFTATPKTFWQNVGAFFKQWWWCFAVGFGGIVVITVISVIVEQKKKKA